MLQIRGLEKTRFGWLRKHEPKDARLGGLEMPDLPWFNIEGRYSKGQRDGDVGVDLFLRPTHLPWEVPEDTPFTMTMRSKFVRGTPPLKSSVSVLLCQIDLRVGAAVTELGNLNAVGVQHPKVAESSDGTTT